MISVRTAFLTLALTAGAAGAAGAQQLPLKRMAKPTRPAITAEDLMSRLYVYADDSMGGRAGGTPYNDKATGIIADWARKIGLTPAGDSGTYFQSVPLTRRTWDVTSPVVGGTTYAYQKDFGVFAQWMTKPFDGADVVFGGLLGDTSVHLTAEQTNGKVVVFGFTPEVVAKGLQVQFGMALSRPIFGAAAVVLPMLDNAPAGVRAFLMRKESVTAPPAGPTRTMPPVIIASDAMAAALVGGQLAQAKWGSAGARYTGKVALVETATSARNVVATIEGSDPVLKHEYVAIGAHNDHVGMGGTPVDKDSLKAFNDIRNRLLLANNMVNISPEARAGIRVNMDSIRKVHPKVRLDSIRNGADDDGSGSMAVLEIAEAMQAMKVKPKRSTLFVWHTGEEAGLIGSAFFTANPTVPMDSVVAQINIDMIGRGRAEDLPGGGPDYLGVVGSYMDSKDLGETVANVNKKLARPLAFDYRYDTTLTWSGYNNIYGRSDHFNYARQGVPIVFFFTGLHGDYHQASDEPEFIDYPHYSKITNYVRDLTVEVGNGPRPRINGTKPARPPRTAVP